MARTSSIFVASRSGGQPFCFGRSPPALSASRAYFPQDELFPNDFWPKTSRKIALKGGRTILAVKRPKKTDENWNC
jgi:hypothetical protein